MPARGYEFHLRVFNLIFPPAGMQYSVYYINKLKQTNNDVFDVFPYIPDQFPKISEDFPKLFQNCSQGKTNVSKHFSNIFRRLPKITEDFRGGTDDVSMMFSKYF